MRRTCRSSSITPARLFRKLPVLFFALTRLVCHGEGDAASRAESGQPPVALPPQFAARMEIQVKSAPGAPGAGMMMTNHMVRSGDNLRMELTLALPAEARVSMKQIGMDFAKMGLSRFVVITRGDRRSTIFIYPDLKAYCETPMSPQVYEAHLKGLHPPATNELVKLGNETFDGHPCEKVETREAGPAAGEKSVVWLATDLERFPIRIDAPRSTVQFRDVRLARPDAAQFEAPAGFTRHEDLGKLIASVTASQKGNNFGSFLGEMLIHMATGAAGGAIGGAIWGR